MKFRLGEFGDLRGGKGYFCAFLTRAGWVLFAIRPTCWRMAVTRPQYKPGVTRIYCGPFEIERSRHFIKEPVSNGSSK